MLKGKSWLAPTHFLNLSQLAKKLGELGFDWWIISFPLTCYQGPKDPSFKDFLTFSVSDLLSEWTWESVLTLTSKSSQVNCLMHFCPQCCWRKKFFHSTSFIACSQVVAIYVSWNTRDKDEVVRWLSIILYCLAIQMLAFGIWKGTLK